MKKGQPNIGHSAREHSMDGNTGGYQKHQDWPEIVPENSGSSFRDTRT